MREMCPNCEVLLDNCYDPVDQNEDPCFVCPNCGETWTPDEIAEALGALDE